MTDGWGFGAVAASPVFEEADSEDDGALEEAPGHALTRPEQRCRFGCEQPNPFVSRVALVREPRSSGCPDGFILGVGQYSVGPPNEHG